MKYALILALLLTAVTANAQEAPTPKGPIEDAIATKGFSVIPELGKWLYQTASSRGVIGASWDYRGDKTLAAAIKLNNKGPVYLLIGAEVLIEKEIDKLLENNPNAGRWRAMVAPTLDLFDVWDKLREKGPIKKLELIQIPSKFELLVGPELNAPTTGWRDWTWKTHLKAFIAFRVKGG